MIKYRKFGVLTLSLMILSVFSLLSVNALSEENYSVGEVPALPLILRGGLNVGGEPVSEGSEILAYYEGELIGKSTVVEEGQYTLNLNLTPDDYANIGKVELSVNDDNSSFDVPVSEIAAINKTPGSISEIDLEVSVPSADTNVSSSSKGSSSSSDSEGDVKIVKKDSESSEDSTSEDPIEVSSSEKGDSSAEDGESSFDVSEPVSQTGEEGDEETEKSGYSSFFTGLLFITALLGAFYVIKK